jgi:hypothetical protein
MTDRPMPSGLADPIVSANVYCSGRLSEVIHRAVAPFWTELKRSGDADSIYLWIMRYAKCGDHLKIRLHGPAWRRQRMLNLLAGALESYLGSLGPGDPAVPQKTASFATPIDEDDFAESDYPDRTYRWTRYLRSPVSLGFAPYLHDDGYVSLLTVCLSRGTEILFARLKTGQDGQASHQEVQRILLLALVAGLSALPLTWDERLLYIAYHRDWLLRALLKRPGGSGGPERAEQLLARLEAEAAKQQSALGRLAELAYACCRDGVASEWDGDLAAWRGALCRFARYLEPRCGALSHHVDPFAEAAIFPPLFKVMHGFANQLGLKHIDEAFAYHLLLAAVAPPEIRSRVVRLIPVLEDEG